jgi:signal transduction histidine kinase
MFAHDNSWRDKAMSLASIRYFWRSADPIPSAIRLAIWYVLIAGGWIIVSDRLLRVIATNAEDLTNWQTLKGWVFVAIMAIWLGIERWRTLTHNQMINDKLRAANAELQELNASLERRIAEHIAPLQTANQELSELNQELETFTSIVSHDLKAPLRVIDGYSQLLFRFHASHLDEDGRQCIQNIRAAIKQMNQLIDDLLTYTHIERKPLHYTIIDLDSIIQEILDFYTDQIMGRGVIVERELRCSRLRGDATGLAIALRNLIDNALKFSVHVPQPRLTIGSDIQHNAVRLWVKDNGIGFDMRDHDRIFTIFQRLHPQEAYPGTGIGLAIVRKAVERMGGRVWAESSPGVGATFYLEIPNANASSSPPTD